MICTKTTNIRYDNRIIQTENISELFPILNILDLSFNKIKEINKLPSNLKQVYFAVNKIENIKNLNDLNQLEILELGGNKIRIIEGLDDLKSLLSLWLGKNKITIMENMNNLTNLKILSLNT